NAPDNQQRIAGFMEVLAAAGIDTARIWIGDGNFTPEGGWACATQLMASGHPFTAVFCANDEMAVGAMSCFNEAGVAVPGQVSVLGYDDTHSAAFTAPRLSTVHIPWSEMTMNGLNFLLDRCYDMERPVARQYPLTVTMRASLAALAK
ncbi:MAG: substrate-binding domain-containing protein, partial [Sphingomonadaceae bacterium]